MSYGPRWTQAEIDIVMSASSIPQAWAQLKTTRSYVAVHTKWFVLGRKGTRTRTKGEAAHGTVSRYNSPKWKCRCGECRAANATYQREADRARRRLRKDVQPPAQKVSSVTNRKQQVA